MKTFDVYKHPLLGFQVVKQGFSWPAFFFTAIWAFVKKLWPTGCVLVGAFILFLFLEALFIGKNSRAGYFLICLGELLFCIWVGVEGNKWRRKSLLNRGFEKRTVHPYGEA